MKVKHIFFMAIALGVASTAFILTLNMLGEESIKEVPCYDRFENQIQGVKCTEKIIIAPEGIPQAHYDFMMGTVGLILFFIMIMMMMMLPLAVMMGDEKI